MPRKGKKRKPLPPRHKRMKRPARLQAAKHWLAKYPGTNVVTGYKKHFAVDAICTLLELQMLGVKLDPEYVQRVRSSEESRIEARRRERERKKTAAVPPEFDGESDETFAYIAGYTGWGFLYGITWEEMEGLKEERWGQVAENGKPSRNYQENDDEIPF